MRIGSCVIAVLLAATSVLAHHSNSAFDGDKVMVLTGTVTEWKWTNPHVWIFLSVDEGKGSKVQWEIEGRTPGQLVRAGWSRTLSRPVRRLLWISARRRTARAPASSRASGALMAAWSGSRCRRLNNHR